MTTPLKRVCAWCKCSLGEGGADDGSAGPGAQVTHGICPPCFREQLAEIELLRAEADRVREGIARTLAERN